MNRGALAANKRTPLSIQLLISGFDISQEKWSIHRAWTQDTLNFLNTAQELTSAIRTRSFDAFCALRSSGIPFGALLSYEYQKPLFWFIDASDHALFPRHISLRGLRVLVIDSHIITGGNMTRHIEILRRIGAIVESAWVILDCDEFRDPKMDKRIQLRLGEVKSLWKLSQLKTILQQDLEESEEIRTLYEVILKRGKHFWRQV